MIRRRKKNGNARIGSNKRLDSLRRMVGIGFGALALALAANFASADRLYAQTPGCLDTSNVSGNYVKGPWMSIVPLFWISPDPCYEDIGGDVDKDYPLRPSMSVEVFDDVQKEECYPSGEEPANNETNSLYLMMSCRVGKVAGVITWTSVGLVLLVFAYAGLMFVVDSAGSEERLGQMRDMVTGPLIGLAIVFFGYVFAEALVAIMRYNFTRYFFIEVPSGPAFVVGS